MADSRAGEVSPPILVRTLSKGRSRGVDFVGQLKVEAREFFLDSKLNILLVAMPLAFISRFTGWSDGATFTLSCLALVPLAERLGFVTEQLAMYTNDTLGGLLNATFGNATEIIISAFAMIQARKQKSSSGTYLRVVQLSLLGSVASNLLLVMGTAFIAGGLKTKAQTFNQTGINVNAGMLVLSCFAVMLPSLLDATQSGARSDNRSELALSRFESIFMFLCYCIYLYFQLKSHSSTRRTSNNGAFTPQLGATTETDLEAATLNPTGTGGGGNGLPLSRTSLDGREVTIGGRYSNRQIEMAETKRTTSGRSVSKVTATDRERDVERLPLVLAATRAGGLEPTHVADDDDGSHRSRPDDAEEEELVLSRTGCFLWLTGVTVFIAFLSEFVTDSIKHAGVHDGGSFLCAAGVDHGLAAASGFQCVRGVCVVCLRLVGGAGDSGWPCKLPQGHPAAADVLFCGSKLLVPQGQAAYDVHVRYTRGSGAHSQSSFQTAVITVNGGDRRGLQLRDSIFQLGDEGLPSSPPALAPAALGAVQLLGCFKAVC
ncbi:hypothetical protein VaNZ11_014108 [Volvox africanus]|uniref:Sodium/calcium exchanger membrane region domain-containing protein n=1 Tax=Volvox africanus TaxID=51714 RepID=A0ABQ5SIK3_9CHLO|nr:hypothetical protein VaNZ11_014108 [Volvox africanus]